jgi:hypothetical protein
MKHSTAVPRDFCAEFHTDPLNKRVCLPDGSLAVVRRVIETDTGKLYRVQGIHQNGRFRALDGVSCWYSVDELRLPYFVAYVRDVAA